MADSKNIVDTVKITADTPSEILSANGDSPFYPESPIVLKELNDAQKKRFHEMNDITL